MTAVALTRAAREDLKSIARHTHARWGLAQRNRYLREIDRTLRALGSNPLLGRNCDEVRAGYR